jgi:hypothetical protein
MAILIFCQKYEKGKDVARYMFFIFCQNHVKIEDLAEYETKNKTGASATRLAYSGWHMLDIRLILAQWRYRSIPTLLSAVDYWAPSPPNASPAI